MNERRFTQLLYLIPVLALGVCAVSLFWRAGEVEIRSAMLMGGPTDSATGFRGRLRVVREVDGMTLPVSEETVRLVAQQGSHESVRSLITGPDGWADFDVSREPRAPLHLLVKDARGRVLVEGTPELSTSRWLKSAQTRGGPLRVHREGELTAQLIISQGVLSVPFASAVIVEVARNLEPLPDAHVKLASDGATIEGATDCLTDPQGRCPFSVRPLHHVASVVAHIKWEGKTLRFEQALPLVPGSFGLEVLASGDLKVRSPVQREEAWFTFVNRQQRSQGGRIELSALADGGSEGVILKSQIPVLKDPYVLIAGSADGRSTSSVGYPLASQGETFDVLDAYLLDGAPQLKALHEGKARRVRFALGAYIGLSGLLTLALFVLRVRRSDRRLQEGLDRVGAASGTRSASAVPLVIAALSLFFAFSATVLWIVAR